MAVFALSLLAIVSLASPGDVADWLRSPLRAQAALRPSLLGLLGTSPGAWNHARDPRSKDETPSPEARVGAIRVPEVVVVIARRPQRPLAEALEAEQAARPSSEPPAPTAEPPERAAPAPPVREPKGLFPEDTPLAGEPPSLGLASELTFDAAPRAPAPTADPLLPTPLTPNRAGKYGRIRTDR